MSGAVYPLQCYAEEDDGQSGLTGGRAGKDQEFQIQLRDKYGNDIHNVTGKQVNINATLNGPTQTEATSSYLDNGKYLVQYNLKKAGNYQLTILLNGEHIKGPASYNVSIIPGSIVGSNCIATNANQDGIAG